MAKSKIKPKENSNPKRNYLFQFLVIIVFFNLLSGCINIDGKVTPKVPTIKTIEIPKFSTCNAIMDAFKSQSNNQYYDREVQALSAPSANMPMAAEADTSSTPQYSQTNVQVQGVDEADIVKTDGKYIYTISNGKLYIAEAYPAKNAEISSATNLKDFTPQEMFIDDNTVLIFGYTQINYPMPYETQDKIMAPGSTAPSSGAPSSEIAPDYYPYYRSFTTLQLWDVSDKGDPELARSLDFEGNYVSSRKIGSTAYFVINIYPNYYVMAQEQGGKENNKENGEILPLYRDSAASGITNNDNFATVVGCDDVGYLEPVQASAFTTIGSISMEDFEAPIEKEVVVASGQNVYSSDKNLYLAEVSYDYGQPVPLPLVGDAIGIVMPEYQSPEEETNIHKFSLNNGEIDYLGQMAAPGRILNQFSMDEFDSHFRIATTKGHVSRGGGDSSNNVYVFDDELDLVGKLEDLAPGERIYSTRFMGKKAYMVTFKKVDPLFVIDLSDPKNPEVLGKLKIPGYSDYLHPIDENHILGLGKETVEAEEGDFAWYQGIKMAVFDVSDVENPKEMHKVIIGDRGTDSSALQDHKAFLYDGEKNLLVIPVLLAEINEIKYTDKYGKLPANTRGDYVFQGAYVYDLTLENGFDLKGRITHVDDGQSFKKSGYYYHDSGSAVKRSLYIDNVLYTLSDNKILANDLDDLELIKELKLTDVIINSNKNTKIETEELTSYIACGCGCCTFDKPLEEIAKVECLYKSKGESIQDKIEQDRQFQTSPPESCATEGCSFPIKYVYCD